MPEPYHSIYLSPHLDDVVLSCGAQIFQQINNGHSVIVATVMAGDPPVQPLSDYASSLHRRWQVDSKSIALRRDEDIAACAVLGADYLHWPIPDCIYRRDPGTDLPLYTSDNDIFGDIDIVEKKLIGRIASLLRELPPHNQLIAPLTIGNHVDHQLVRGAAELVREKAQLRYYEEYPYISWVKDAEMDLLTGPEGKMETMPVSEEALAFKIEAISCYKSQISTFFTGIPDARQRVRSHTILAGGERLWSLSS